MIKLTLLLIRGDLGKKYEENAMKSKILSGCTFILLLVLGLSGQLHAAPWYQPDGLQEGDLYQLAFITSTEMDATSSVFSDYVNFVNQAAANNPTLPQGIWLPIISTINSDAVNNAPVLGPVYNLAGSIVADNLADMWDGSIQNAITLNEILGDRNSTYVFTGTLSNGLRDPGGEVGTAYWVAFAQANNSITGPDWIKSGWTDNSSVLRPFYALSGTLTAQSVPLPSAVWLLGSGIIGLAGVSRRKENTVGG